MKRIIFNETMQTFKKPASWNWTIIMFSPPSLCALMMIKVAMVIKVTVMIKATIIINVTVIMIINVMLFSVGPW